MNELNKQVISNWTMKDYADAYYDYLNNHMTVACWYSSMMPEFDDGYAFEFLSVCRRMARIARK